MEEQRLAEVKKQLRAGGLDVQEAGLEIAKVLDQAVVGHSVPSPLKIGYAGCALGTSAPLLKDISVVKMRDTYDLYVCGEAKG